VQVACGVVRPEVGKQRGDGEGDVREGRKRVAWRCQL
jgi:hypothetical protein